MVRVTFNLRTVTIGTAIYSIFVHNQVGDTYFQYDPDNMYIAGGDVYFKIGESAGRISELLAGSHTEGETLDAFGLMVYHAGAWYMKAS